MKRGDETSANLSQLAKAANGVSCESGLSPRIVEVSDLNHFYGSTEALRQVEFTAPLHGTTAVVGPDGVGKSTLLGVVGGMKRLQSGVVRLFDTDVREITRSRELRQRIGFMPQGLGRSLYPSLSIFENIDFIGRLFGLRRLEREHRIHRLLHATDLYPFRDRPAINLSGGMRQKLQLCCALVHEPELLILDEPTTGVDPLSRRQFWSLVDELRKECSGGVSLIVSTAYIEEASRFDHLVAMHAGRILIAGKLSHILEKTGKANLEDAYVSLLPERELEIGSRLSVTQYLDPGGPPAMQAENLTRQFGNFCAVDRVSFTIRSGEIFGFLGSNGCGKTTTMKMLTGLLEVTDGTAKMFGKAVDAREIASRSRIGYMSQSFSLYEELTVRQNLVLQAQIYCFDKDSDINRLIANALDDFSLNEYADALPAKLPLGIRQRLQLAAACIHMPEILILDEPTSGVDPLTRDRFWRHLIRLSREKHITIFVSTHFMNEAARCDRVSLMHHGRLLAIGAPNELMRVNNATNLDDVFVKYLREFDADHAHEEQVKVAEIPEVESTSFGHRPPARYQASLSFIRLWSFARREAIEILHDKTRLAFAILGPIVFLCIAAYSVSFDIGKVRYTVIDHDQTQLSRGLIDELATSPNFNRVAPKEESSDAANYLRQNDINFVIEIPPSFGHDILSGRKSQIGLLIDGSKPLSALNFRSYVAAVVERYANSISTSIGTDRLLPINVEPRFLFNQRLKSIYAITPGIIMLGLTLFPTMMAALGIVREREIGSLVNLYLSPARTIELIVGKQLTYAFFSTIAFLGMIFVTIFLIGVQLNGSFVALLLGAELYILASVGFGLLLSVSVRSQVAALFGAAILCLTAGMNYSGLLFPVLSLDSAGRAIAVVLPPSWFQQIVLGAFGKELGVSDLVWSYSVLVACSIAYVAGAFLMLGKQET